MEELSCKVCLESFSDREQLINPCKCSGSVKYICKECLNTILNMNKDGEKYLRCQDCHGNFKRDYPDKFQELNSEVLNEVCFAIGALILFCICMLELGRFNSIYSLTLLFFYFITLFLMATLKTLGYSVENLFSCFILVWFVCLFTPYDFSYILFSLWVISVFAIACYRIIDHSWNCILRLKYTRILQSLNVMMFDFDLNKYVSGII